jgi:VWFA-related protein
MRITGPLALPLLALALVSSAAPLAGAQAPVVTTIDVVVTTTEGRSVADIRPDELIVRLNGRPQTVTGVRVTRAATSPVRAGLPLPYGTNDGVAGRTTAVVIDVARLASDRADNVRSGLAELTRALAPTDRLALIPLAGDTRPVDFTTTHTRVMDAAAALTLRSTPTWSAKQDAEAVESTLGALGRAAVMLGAEPGVKTLVLVTEPFAVSSRLRESIQALGERVARNRIAFYIVLPHATAVPAGNGINALASGTGGLVLPLGSWPTAVVQEHARVELSLSEDEDLDAGTMARALVTATRPGLVTRSAPFAYVPTTVSDGLTALTDMLRQSRPFTDLPLRVAAYPILHSDRSSIRLLILGDTIEADRSLAWSEFGLIAPDGRMTAQWTETREALAQRPFISGVMAPEGVYRLRWAASELSGRRGTVDVDVDARFTQAGPFRLSALMLGRLAADTFVPVLQPAPEATDVEWYAEVYGDLTAGQTLTTRLDVATSLTGTALSTTPGRVLTSPDPSRRAITGSVDVRALEAGDYLLRATLVVNGTDAGTVMRTFRKAR